MNIRMPESCTNNGRCGTSITFWLNGSHPQISDGIISRQACGSEWNSGGCCPYSVSIRVKACPGNYYVYEFIDPNICYAAYCADVSTITPVIDPMKVNSTTAPVTDDPCYNYTALDQPWRSTNATRLGVCDNYFNGNIWYRLLYHGMNIRMPESCMTYYSCGTEVTFWLNGPHPQISDGIITRQACGSWTSGCCQYSVSIQVKACPQNYYVYKFVSPNVCFAGYCADVNSITPGNNPMKVNSTTAPATSDPCFSYTTLDQPWRATNGSQMSICDDNFNWNGWYRLLYNGMNIRMPESCINYNRCGTFATFWLNGSHPQISDGIITRQACGSWINNCCTWSVSIRLKACKGNYYVYEFVKPNVCIAAYCADVNSITPVTDPLKVDSTTAPATSEPCYNYTTLDQPWRATTVGGSYVCDNSFNGKAWYRLLYNGMNIRMPEICTNYYRCGTSDTFWLNGPHPQISDGIVTRQACGMNGGCCGWSVAIRVKACPENYYVYEFVSLNFCNAAYCADMDSITPVIDSVKMSSTTAPDVSTIQPISTTTEVPPNITMSEGCQANFTSQCGADLFNQIENITAQVLPQAVRN
ncbi:uncharacterized protein LOC107197226 [Astyanax mexicanus]|uniref:uncharacterized protein LOC107197226 n=1 Tax=Astyanax mexicanus TaxID=7994 RepID=UPI0020CB2844|nr:uncharacterized protein LOC107197226 [Astyanax mexicanus]